MKKTREIVVVSGKGGTGKTTVTAALAEIFPEKIIADADVDAANLFLLLKPRDQMESEFKGNVVARVDLTNCSGCNLCRELCRFGAVNIHNGDYEVDPLSCEGCSLCVDACPERAIKMIEQAVGKWFVSDTDFGAFIYARLKPGSENSGKLVTMVRKQAKILAAEKKIKTILIDGPPGIGCPVIATLSGSDYALIVSEPTFSGISDLDRIVKLVEHFGVPRGIVINRYDINMENTREIEKLAKRKKIKILARIPHSFCILKEISGQNIPFKNCPELKKEIKTIYNKLERITENKREV